MEEDEVYIKRMKTIGSVAECFLELGFGTCTSLLLVFLVLIQDEPVMLIVSVLGLGIGVILLFSQDEQFIVRYGVTFLLPWYSWVIRSLCYFLASYSVSDSILDYGVSLVAYPLPVIYFEIPGSGWFKKGIGLRILTAVVMIVDLIPFRDSNPFFSLEIGTARVVLAATLFMMHSLRRRYQETLVEGEHTLAIFIQIHYVLYGAFWFAVVFALGNAIYLAVVILSKFGKGTVIQEEDDDQEEDTEQYELQGEEEPQQESTDPWEEYGRDDLAYESSRGKRR